MKQHKKLNFKEREEILRLSAQSFSCREIARRLNRHHSSISRELRRNGMTRLTYSLAEAQVDRNIKVSQTGRRRKIVKGTKLYKRIRGWLIDLRWSPEQISNRLKMESGGRRDVVSHETIYQYIYSIKDYNEKSKWIGSLRQKRKKRLSKTNKGIRRCHIPNRISIHERPQVVESRNEPGHWEGDLIVGKGHGSAIGTLVERSSRFTIIVNLPNGKTSDEVVKAFGRAFERIPIYLRKSLTYDNGSEMTSHCILSDLTGIKIYFADPGCPGQRGTNENTNGLIRDFFPKSTDFSKVSEEAIKHVEKILNQRPRKTLRYESPEKVFWRHIANSEPPDKHQLKSGEESSGDLVL